MKTQVRPGRCAFETDMIEKDQFGEPNNFLGDGHHFFAGGAGVVSERSEFPFHIDDTAVFRRKFGFGYVFAHKRRFFLISTKGEEKSKAKKLRR
jgi:hypothetical protein